MEKRYQIFISSTFEDLKDERQGVLRASIRAMVVSAKSAELMSAPAPSGDDRPEAAGEKVALGHRRGVYALRKENPPPEGVGS